MKDKIFKFIKRFSIGIIWVLSLLLVFGLGMQTNPIETKIKEVPTDKIVTKEVIKEVPVVSSECKALKEIDDKGFKYCSNALTLSAENSGLCSEIITAIINDDVAEINIITAKVQENTILMKEMATDISTVANERNLILKSLGY